MHADVIGIFSLGRPSLFGLVVFCLTLLDGFHRPCPAQNRRIQPEQSFAEFDRDADAQLTQQELFGTDLNPEKSSVRDFVIADLNLNQTLDSNEFELFRNLANPTIRSGVPDPIVDACDELFSEILAVMPAELSTDGQGVSPPAWAAAKLPGWILPLFHDFDRDGNNLLVREELKWGLAVAYGLHTPDGISLRSDNGTRFDWRHYFVTGDRNTDGRLTSDELRILGRTLPERLWPKLIAVDRNRDGIFEVAELMPLPFTWRDVVGRFRQLDGDLDGFLNQPEMDQLPDWEQRYSSWVIPFADENRDGKLSLTEFLKTPLANPFLKWANPVTDTDGDGQLSLAEFHPGTDWKFLGLSQMYFQALDQDADGRLSLAEFRFNIEPATVPAELAFLFYDANLDHELSPAELFPQGELQGSSGPLFIRHLRMFEQADTDFSGAVTRDEFVATPDLVKAALTEQKLVKTVLAKFRFLDADHDGGMTFENIAPHVKEDQRDEFRYNFLLSDFNRDGQLSFQEFASLPNADADLRGTIYDPLVELGDQLVQEVAPTQHASLQTASTLLLEKQLGIVAEHLQNWDRNGDESLTRAELRRGLAEHLGIRDPSGIELRSPTGQMLDVRSFHKTDLNQNGYIERDEFSKGRQRDPAEVERLFAVGDANKDGRIGLEELEGKTIFWSDVLNLFRKLDADRDLGLSHQELLEGANPWERELAQRALRSFDLDADGLLSFAEFRSTPMANPMHFWESAKDLDADGRISRKEFVSAFPEGPVGQTHWMFSKLDANGDAFLTITEYKIPIDLHTAPPEIVFETLDRNFDQFLTAPEAAGLRPANLEAERRYEAKVMRLEDAFRVADLNQDHQLSREEFLTRQAELLPIIRGKTPQRVQSRPVSTAATPMGRDTPVRQPSLFIQQNEASEENVDWDWRVIGLLAVNALIVVFVLIALVKPKSEQFSEVD